MHRVRIEAVTAFLLILLRVSPLGAQSPVAAPSLTCSAAAPDSIFFDKVAYNRYLNGTFTLHAVVRNEGAQRADSLFAFVQSTRGFTIVPPPVKQIADSLLTGDSVAADFLLTVNPRDASGMDTVTVTVTGKGGARTDCRWVLWVEKEYVPLNRILCPPDSSILIAFSDSLNDYAPNPISVTVSMANIGEAPSKETRIIFVATPGVAPAPGQDPIYDLGDVPAGGGNMFRTFRLAIVPRAADTTVTLAFRVQGKGGLGDRIIDTLCSFTLHIPAVRTARFQLECRNDIRIEYKDGRYVPNPFTWETTVRNTGDAAAMRVQAIIALPATMQLDTGSVSAVPLGTLAPGASRLVQWRIRALPGSAEDTSAICVTVVDAFQHSARCCDTIIVPAALRGAFTAACAILPDSIFSDPATGQNLRSDFTVRLSVLNSGTDAIDSVDAVVRFNDPTITPSIPPTAAQAVAARLLPLERAEVQWVLDIQPQPFPRTIPIQVAVRGLRADEAVTVCSLYVEAALQPVLGCALRIEPPDTLHYVVPQLSHEPCLLRATLANTGKADATGVTAAFLPSPHFSLAPGEQAIQSRGMPLKRDSLWEVTWRIEPVEQRDGFPDTLRVAFRSGALETSCAATIFVNGVPPRAILRMPRNLLERYGRELQVPVTIDDPRTKDINRFDLTIRHDPRALEFLGYSPGALTDSGWSLTDAALADGMRIRGVSSVGPLGTAGDLLVLTYRVLFGGGDDVLKVTESEIRFDTLASTLNDGSVIAFYYHGLATLSGACNFPDSANDRFVIAQAGPNPSAGMVRITCAVPAAGPLRATVYDVFGRPCAFAEGAMEEKGIYTATFDLTGRRDGTYFCILEGSGFRGFCRFVVAR